MESFYKKFELVKREKQRSTSRSPGPHILGEQREKRKFFEKEMKTTRYFKVSMPVKLLFTKSSIFKLSDSFYRLKKKSSTA